MSSESCHHLCQPAVKVSMETKCADCESCIIFAYMSTPEPSNMFSTKLTQNYLFFDKLDVLLQCYCKNYVQRYECCQSEIVSDVEESGNTCDCQFKDKRMKIVPLNFSCDVDHLHNSGKRSHSCARSKTVFQRIRLLQMDSHLAGIVTEEIIRSPIFVKHFLKYAAKMGALSRSLVCCACGLSLKAKSKSHQIFCTIVEMSFPSKFCINYSWCDKIIDLVTKRMILEDAMNWLSTLGGAYSALGDYFEHHAVNARVVSMRQLRIALEMGSPPVVIRCCLYLSLSLMQSGRLHEARILIRRKYEEAKRLPVVEKQLLSMCRGLWSRLRYLRAIQRSSLNRGR